MNRRAALRGGAVLLILVVGFVVGIYTDQAYPEYLPYFGHRSVSGVDLTELQQAVRLVQADYVDSKIDTTKLAHGTVQGLISSLGDPFSAYFDPDQYKRLQQSYNGRYSGIGIYLSFTTGYPVITGTVPGSPAAGAGLQAGVKGRPRGRTAPEMDVCAVLPRRQLHAQLQTQIVRCQNPLIAADEFNVAQARASGVAQRRLRCGGIVAAVGRMRSNDIGYAQINIPVGVRAVIDPRREIPIERLALEFDPIRHPRDGTSAAAQLVLMDVVIFKAETPSGLCRVAHGRIGVQGAAT